MVASTDKCKLFSETSGHLIRYIIKIYPRCVLLTRPSMFRVFRMLLYSIGVARIFNWGLSLKNLAQQLEGIQKGYADLK